MGVAGPFFEPYPSNLVRIHIFSSCKYAKILVALPQTVWKLAKSVWSAPSISWDVLGIAHSCRSNMTRDMVTSMKKIDRKNAKNYKIWKFLKNKFCGFLIISLVTFNIQMHTKPQIKAKDIVFGPYYVNFLAKINI